MEDDELMSSIFGVYRKVRFSGCGMVWKQEQGILLTSPIKTPEDLKVKKN